MKIDRTRLPAPAVPSSPAGHGIRPADAEALDAEIAAIIGRLLDVPSFGLEENFFEAGGQSMLAMRLLTQVGRRYSVDMTLVEFFEDPTAAGIARWLRQRTEAAARGAKAREVHP